MKNPIPGTRSKYCTKCGKELMVADEAEPFYSFDTGEPYYYAVDMRCPVHGQITKPLATSYKFLWWDIPIRDVGF